MDKERSAVQGTLDSLYCNRMSAILITLAATLSVTFIALVANLRRRKRLPPGPFAWPVLGNFPSLSTGGGLPHEVLRSLAQKYGGLMYLRLGSVPTIVVSSVEVSKELFQTLDTIFLARPNIMALSVLNQVSGSVLNDNSGNRVLTARGRHWRDLRKLITSELFSARRLSTYKAARAEEIQNMMKGMVEDAKRGSIVNLKSWLLGITCNNMTRMLTNKRYFGNEDDNEAQNKVKKKEKENFDQFMKRFLAIFGTFIISDSVPYLGFVTKLQGWPKKFEELQYFINGFADKMFELEKHRQGATERQKGGNDEAYVPDMVDVLLQTPLDSGQIIADESLTLILSDLLIGGTETSAGTVEYAMAELMRRPEIMQRLQDELNTVVGPDRVPQESDLPNLPFLEAVVKETFRLHPPTKLNLPRESTQAFEFRGFRLPNKTRLIINFFAIHRDPSVYESPDAFKPERFCGHTEINHLAAFQSFELTPFSAGRRMCPAAELGNMLVSMMLAHLAHSFDWELPKGVDTVDMSEEFGLTVTLKNPLRLVATAKPPAYLYI